jgi:hypothetical protein
MGGEPALNVCAGFRKGENRSHWRGDLFRCVTVMVPRGWDVFSAVKSRFARSRWAASVATITILGSILVPLTAAPASATDPNHVSFTLEGCRGSTGSFPANGPFVCPDDEYTTGNLGGGWNELDLVPYRITADATNAAPATQTYTIAIVADNSDAGHPGYDFISVPVLNTDLSDASCTAPVVGAQTTLTPGLGGIDASIYRLVTITQTSGSTCVYDYYERLALGSHLFPGSSLHSNLANENLSTAGIGARDVSIPVKEILPQSINKTMVASTGSDHIWSVT